MKSVVEETNILLDSKGELPTLPPILGGKKFTELLKNKELYINIDPKFPQALGIKSILSHTANFGNFKWDILINSFDDSPFFTSDFPVAIEKTDDIRILNRIVPLTPNLAIRIRPDLSVDRNRVDFSFSKFGYSIRKLNRKAVTNINQLIVRCAETTVFFRDDYKWVLRFVKKNAGFRIEPRTKKNPHGNGNLLWFKLEVSEIG